MFIVIFMVSYKKKQATTYICYQLLVTKHTTFVASILVAESGISGNRESHNVCVCVCVLPQCQPTQYTNMHYW